MPFEEKQSEKVTPEEDELLDELADILFDMWNANINKNE